MCPLSSPTQPSRDDQSEFLIVGHQERWKALNEINAGSCEELTYEEVKAEICSHMVDIAIDRYFSKILSKLFLHITLETNRKSEPKTTEHFLEPLNS